MGVVCKLCRKIFCKLHHRHRYCHLGYVIAISVVRKKIVIILDVDTGVLCAHTPLFLPQITKFGPNSGYNEFKSFLLASTLP